MPKTKMSLVDEPVDPPKVTDLYLGQTVRIDSLTPELNGAIALVSRVVQDWREGNGAALYLVYSRRMLHPDNILHITGSETVYQVTIKEASPLAGPNSEFRKHQGVWVNEVELGRVCNKFNTVPGFGKESRFTSKEIHKYLGDPNNRTCPFSTCSSSNTRLLGFGCRNTYKAKYECLDCEGTWKETLQVVGVE